MRERTLTPLGLVALIAVGCAIEQPCGPDLVLDEAISGCVAPPAPDAGPVDAGAPLDAGDASAGPADAGPQDAATCPAPGFGDPCTAAGAGPECPCEADFCALQPNAQVGFCTRTGCLPPGAPCPTGYTCMDLTAIAPEVGSICVPR